MRVLAMDAVQKVGNGHPGTAMSLAPAAYLLFQKVMRHDPADPRLDSAATGSCSPAATPASPSTSSSTSAATASSSTTSSRCAPGAARPRATRSTATPPASRPPPARSARASATRSAWRWRPAASAACSTRTPPAGESLFDHHIYALCSRRRPRGGRQRRGLLARRAPAARQPDPDLRRQPDLDRGRHQHRVHRGRRRALRGLRLARADRRLDQRRPASTTRTSPRCTTRSRRPSASPTSRSFIRAQDDHRLARARTSRTPARPTAPPSAPTRSPPPRRSSASTPSRPSRCRRAVIEHTRELRRARRRGRTPTGRRAFDAWAPQAPERRSSCSTGCRSAELPEGWADALPDVRRPTRRGSPPARPPAT